MATRWRKDRHEPETGRDAQTGRQTVPRSPDRRRDRAVDSALQGACWACLPQEATRTSGLIRRLESAAAAAEDSTPTPRLAQLRRRPPRGSRRRSTSSFRTIPHRRLLAAAAATPASGKLPPRRGTAVGEPAHVPLVAIENRCGDGDCQDGRPSAEIPSCTSPGWPASTGSFMPATRCGRRLS